MSKRKRKAPSHLRLLRGQRKKAGMPPGSVVYTGEQPAQPQQTRIMLMDYDDAVFEERILIDIDQAFDFKMKSRVTWINIDGIQDENLISKVGKHFDLHPLVQEDIVDTNQRAKMEEYDGYLYMVLRAMQYNYETHEVESEQFSLILSKNYLITFQERPGDVFDEIRDRLRTNKGRVRREGCDYLAYSLIDAIVDHYFVILDTFSERLEALEDQLLDNPSHQVLTHIHELKRELTLMRKTIWPLRELVNSLQRTGSLLVSEQTRLYLRDVYDHTIHIMDTIESLRDVVTGMLEIYLSSLSNRMNAVMKVLAVIATIFMPLSFITGVYGMNFHDMPEMSVGWTYPWGFWAVIITVALTMLIIFRKNKWL